MVDQHIIRVSHFSKQLISATKTAREWESARSIDDNEQLANGFHKHIKRGLAVCLYVCVYVNALSRVVGSLITYGNRFKIIDVDIFVV